MKRILTLAVLAATLLLFAATPSTTGVLQKEAMTFATADSLKAATSADTIISGPFTIGKCQEFLGAEVLIDRVYGGGAGAIYFQGRVGDRAWENIWFCNFSDSLRMVNTLAVSGAVEPQKYFVLSVSPFGEGNPSTVPSKFPATPTGLISGMYLPYDQVRYYLLDTNWTLSGHCHGTWLYR